MAAPGHNSDCRPTPVGTATPDPLASVIVVNWNGGEMLLAALSSLIGQSISRQLEIILVDNASSDGSDIAAEEEFGEQVTLVRSPENRGFAGGNNLGFARARGEYLLLLNNDAVAEPAWAEQLLAAATSASDIGMCSSKILCYDQSDVIDNCGHLMYADGLNRSRGHMERDTGQYETSEEILFASGCAALYHRETVMAVGGFDEAFFAYGDDADLGLMLRRAGMGCLYVPGAIVRHRQSASSGSVSRRKLFWIERNRVWVMFKHFPFSWILVSPWHTLVRLWASWRAGQRGEGVAGQLSATHSSASLVLCLCHAWLVALWHLPGMLQQRSRLRRLQRITPDQLRELLKRFRASVNDMSFGGGSSEC